MLQGLWLDLKCTFLNSECNKGIAKAREVRTVPTLEIYTNRLASVRNALRYSLSHRGWIKLFFKSLPRPISIIQDSGYTIKFVIKMQTFLLAYHRFLLL